MVTGTDADEESAASRGPEPRLTLEEEIVAGSGTATTGVVPASILGAELLDQLNPTMAKLTRAIEEEVKRYPAAQRLRAHPGVGPLDGVRLRADYRESGSVSVWQADRELSGTGDGEVERESLRRFVPPISSR